MLGEEGFFSFPLRLPSSSPNPLPNPLGLRKGVASLVLHACQRPRFTRIGIPMSCLYVFGPGMMLCVYSYVVSAHFHEGCFGFNLEKVYILKSSCHAQDLPRTRNKWKSTINRDHHNIVISSRRQHRSAYESRCACIRFDETQISTKALEAPACSHMHGCACTC